MPKERLVSCQKNIGICLMVMFVCVLGIFSYRRCVRAVFLPVSKYDQVKGVIVRSRLKQVEARGYARKIYDVVYQYEVNGKRYRSDQIDFRFVKTSGTDAAEATVISMYPVGKEVVVYYQRNHPEFAVLRFGVPLETQILVFCLLTALILSFCGAGRYWYLLLRNS